MLTHKDLVQLTEAYISASQKYVNVPHKVTPKQPDEQGPAETLEDRMQSVSAPSVKREDSADDDYADDDYADDTNKITDDNSESSNSQLNVLVRCFTDNSSSQEKFSKMSKSDLYSTFKCAAMLYKLINNGYELEPWMIQKITLCAESMSNILRVMEYNVAEAQADESF